MRSERTGFFHSPDRSGRPTRATAAADLVRDSGPEIDRCAAEVEAHDHPRDPQARLRILELQHLPVSLVTGFGEPSAPGAARPLGARDTERIERDVQGGALDWIELGVHQAPRPARLIPYLADPVVPETRRREVRAEAASRAGRDASGAQERAEEHGEVTTVADETSLRGSRLAERSRIEREHPVDHLRCPPDFQILLTKRGRGEAVERARNGC